jgi:acyl-CoA synthetase (AMP-forming)/AMP-acid ligase II
MRPATLFTLLGEAASRNGGAPAILDRGETVSYADFHDGVLSAAHRLRARLERPGGIAIRAPEPQELLRLFFACAAIGRPAMPLDPALPPQFVEALFAAHPLAALIAQGEGGGDRAFSGKVEPGFPSENTTKQRARAPFRFNRNGKGSSGFRGTRSA